MQQQQYTWKDIRTVFTVFNLMSMFVFARLSFCTDFISTGRRSSLALAIRLSGSGTYTRISASKSLGLRPRVLAKRLRLIHLYVFIGEKRQQFLVIHLTTIAPLSYHFNSTKKYWSLAHLTLHVLCGIFRMITRLPFASEVIELECWMCALMTNT